MQIKSVALHPDYNTVTLENDLAVVTLGGMPSSRELREAGVYPAQLNSVRRRPWLGEEVSLTGWGLSSGTFGGTVAAELATTRMRVAATADCLAYLTRRGVDTVGIDDARMICASLGDQTSSCSGDSGGTLGGATRAEGEGGRGAGAGGRGSLFIFLQGTLHSILS